MPNVSVIIPCFNESRHLTTLVERVLASPVPTEIIVVDDGSTDGTTDIIRQRIAPRVARVLFHTSNQGKGAAIRTALPHVTGDIIIIQDADLEYAPEDYPLLVAPILAGRADVVYGSRFIGTATRRHFYWLSALGNRFITYFSNVCTGLQLTDVECGYKVFRTSVLKSMSLQENGFGIEIELTAKSARQRLRIEEVGVSYTGRSYTEGKKITWLDGLYALWCIAKYCGQGQRHKG